MDHEIERIIRAYRDYIEAFQSLDPKAVLPYYQVPFTSLSDREVRISNSPGEIEKSFAGFMDILRKNHYARTEIINLYARRMSKGLALVSVNLERYAKDGKQLGGPGKIYTYTYTLRKTDDNWKIVSAMAHDSAAILRIN